MLEAVRRLASAVGVAHILIKPVLSMIVDGAPNEEIAERLVIATSTVPSHVKRILEKLGVKNRTEAAIRYVRR